MRFVVGTTNRGLESGVDVILVSRKGKLVHLGRTDQSGEFSVRKETLRGGVVVLFCKQEQYFCGAFRVDDPDFNPPGFLEYDEHFIELAPEGML